MQRAIRAAGFSLMTLFASCGVGAQDLDTHWVPASPATMNAASIVAGPAYLDLSFTND
jgi:hypothetical protein